MPAIRLVRLVIAAAVGVGAARLVFGVVGVRGLPGFVLAFALVLIVLQLLNMVWPRRRTGTTEPSDP